MDGEVDQVKSPRFGSVNVQVQGEAVKGNQPGAAEFPPGAEVVEFREAGVSGKIEVIVEMKTAFERIRIDGRAKQNDQQHSNGKEKRMLQESGSAAG